MFEKHLYREQTDAFVTISILRMCHLEVIQTGSKNRLTEIKKKEKCVKFSMLRRHVVSFFRLAFFDFFWKILIIEKIPT